MPPLSYVEIARIEELRQAQGTSEVAGEAQPVAGGWMCFTEVGSWSNQAMGVGLAGPVSGAELDRLVDFYASRGVEPRVEVCPFVDPSLVTGLGERGFRVRAFENVLARELSAGEDLRALHPHGWPPGLEIVAVDPADDEQSTTYADVATSGFRDGPMTAGDLALTRRVLEHPLCDGYLALIDGEPAGAGTLESREPGGALFGVSVLPRFRRRGLQLALMLRRMERARERGSTIVTIGSRPGIPTERNAARLGFFLAYSKVEMVMPGEGLAPNSP